MTVSVQAIQPSLTQVLTKPIYLVEIRFDPVVRISNAKDTLWNGYHWMAAPIEIGSIDNDALGGQTVSMRVNNADRAFGAMVLSQGVQDRPIKIWLTYDPLTAPILFVDGVMDSAGVGQYVDVNIISRSTFYGSTPRILCGPPLMNHLPPDGTVLKTGNVSYTIRSR